MSVEGNSSFSALPESEKCRILRERRKQKFMNDGGSSRLAKITGQQPSSFLSTESPVKNLINYSEKQEEKEFESLQESRNIDDTLTRKLSVEKPNCDMDTTEPQIALLRKFMNTEQCKQGDVDEKDLDFLSSLVGSDVVRDKSIEFNASENSSTETHSYKVRCLRVYSILFRWSMLFLMVYFAISSHNSRIGNMLRNLFERSGFFAVFLTFEILGISVYFHALRSLERLSGINTVYSSNRLISWASLIPEGILPIANIPGKLMILMHYWDVVSMGLTDLSFCIVSVGLIRFFHNLL